MHTKKLLPMCCVKSVTVTVELVNSGESTLGSTCIILRGREKQQSRGGADVLRSTLLWLFVVIYIILGRVNKVPLVKVDLEEEYQFFAELTPPQ